MDDNRDAANLAATLLRHHGQQVELAYNGRSALQMAAEFRPEIVLLDLVMPKMDGFAVAHWLRALENIGQVRMRIFALTAYGQPAFREATSESKFDGHLLKPVSAEDLLKILAAPVPMVAPSPSASAGIH
ncbi:MAG TPA: response regulator [Solimonas sp.]|nr:response regulator [Solimonas sp.]